VDDFLRKSTNCAGEVEAQADLTGWQRTDIPANNFIRLGQWFITLLQPGPFHRVFTQAEKQVPLVVVGAGIGLDVYVQRAGGDGDAVLGVGETQDRVRDFRLTYLCGGKVKQGGETHLLRPGLAVCILSDPLDRRGVADIHRHFLTGEIRAGW